MIRFLVALAIAFAAGPAVAQDMWRHDGSGISLPRTVGGLQLNQEQDASGGGGFDVILQYGDDDTAFTVYVYRSAYPNPALWFERTRMAMSTNVGAPVEGVAPESVTLGGASAPNALREDIAIPAGGRFRATSVAIVQAGEWILKARISSRTLDRGGVSAMMDELLGAARFARMPAPHPLLVPAPCTDSAAMNGDAVSGRPSDEALGAALVTGIVAMAQARGATGLAAEPAQWCREASQIPPQYAAIYRARSGGGWVALIGDSGRAVAAMPIEGDRGAATFVSLPALTSVAALYDALPQADAAAVQAMPIVGGQARGLVEIGSGAERRGKD